MPQVTFVLRARSGSFSVARLLLDLGLVALAAVSLATVFAGVSWVADTPNFFRPHLLVLSLVLLAWALAAGRFRRALAAGALVAFNLWPLMVNATPAHAVALASMPTIRVMSANLLYDNPHADRLRQVVGEIRPDVLVVQEESERWRPVIADLAGLPYVASAQLSHTKDGKVDIASRFPMTVRKVGFRPSPYPNFVGGALAVRAEVNPGSEGRPFVLYAVHSPTPRTLLGWQERARYFEELARLVRAEPPGTPVILAGDWNTPPWSPVLGRFLDEAGLASAEPLPWPSATRFFRTSEQDLPHWLGSPVDRVAVSPQVAVKDFRVGPAFGSDHLPVYADLAIR